MRKKSKAYKTYAKTFVLCRFRKYRLLPKEKEVTTMPDNKLTDNEIIKADYIDRKALLEELNKAPAHFDSGDIRYGIDISMGVIKEFPTADVNDLINRLQAEKEDLKTQFRYLDIECERLEGENKRLYIALEENQKATKIWKDKSETAKAEAYKEFAEKLESMIMWSPKNHISITAKDIDNLLKELVGDK
jgi:regulator of replication initiation timing